MKAYIDLRENKLTHNKANPRLETEFEGATAGELEADELAALLGVGDDERVTKDFPTLVESPL